MSVGSIIKYQVSFKKGVEKMSKCGLVSLYFLLFLSVLFAQPIAMPLLVNGEEREPLRIIQEGPHILVDQQALCLAIEAQSWSNPSTGGITTQRNNRFSVVFPAKDFGMLDGKMLALDVPSRWEDGAYFSSLAFLATVFELQWTLTGDALHLTVPPLREPVYSPRVQLLLQLLDQGGFVVQSGKIVQAFPLEYLASRYAPDANGNNAQNPYLVFLVPPAPGQAFSNNYPFSYRLREDEVLLLVGTTPPACAYFSYRSYLLNRCVDEKGNRQKVFASLGDTVNIQDFQNIPFSTSPFEKPVVVISAADRFVAESVRQTLLCAGFPPDYIFQDIIPSEIVRMGLEPQHDELIFLQRQAIFHDSAQKTAFLQNPPGLVFRLTPTWESCPDPYPTPLLQPRGTGKTEMALANSLDTLQQKILEAYPDYVPTLLKTTLWLCDGFSAIQNLENVIGEVRDTLYLRSEPFSLPASGDAFLVVFGVNHPATGKATYSNFSIYSWQFLNGLGGISNAHYSGTAEQWLEDDPLSPYLYVWKVSRNAGESENCLVVPPDAIPYGIPDNHPAFIGFRSYLEPETGVGPSMEEILLPRVLFFHRPTSPED